MKRRAFLSLMGAAAASPAEQPRVLVIDRIEGKDLVFPPTGTAYREHADAHRLWRSIGLQAPDLVVVTATEDHGLAKALSENTVAEIGRIPARHGKTLPRAGETIAPSDAHQEMTRRLQRTPREVAQELEKTYGHILEQAVYIQAIALIGRLRLGNVTAVRELAEPYASGVRDGLAKATPSHYAGHLVFGELAERTGDPRYTALVRKAADMAHVEPGDMSDAVFMGCPILAKAGKLTGERKYFDLALRHLETMQKLCLRRDGLYRHSPLNDAAWGRGNAFPALALAFALTDMPRGDAAFAPMLRAFKAHLNALAPLQTAGGMWREVIDLPESWEEFTCTAMIGTAMRRGARHGWVAAEYENRAARAWEAVKARTGSDGALIDVCESTGKQKTLADYLNRAAILGPDARGGAMALLFATE